MNIPLHPHMLPSPTSVFSASPSLQLSITRERLFIVTISSAAEHQAEHGHKNCVHMHFHRQSPAAQVAGVMEASSARW